MGKSQEKNVTTLADSKKNVFTLTYTDTHNAAGEQKRKTLYKPTFYASSKIISRVIARRDSTVNILKTVFCALRCEDKNVI